MELKIGNVLEAFHWEHLSSNKIACTCRNEGSIWSFNSDSFLLCKPFNIECFNTFTIQKVEIKKCSIVIHYFSLLNVNKKMGLKFDLSISLFRYTFFASLKKHATSNITSNIRQKFYTGVYPWKNASKEPIYPFRKYDFWI